MELTSTRINIMQDNGISDIYSTIRNRVAGEMLQIHGNAGGLRTSGSWKEDRGDLPLVSIITVVKNCAAHIGETIRSVIHQSYGNIEFLVIDGGSGDGTLELIRQYESYIDLWISGPDGGIYDAMNKALGLARGRYIHFLNADDHFLHQKAVELLVKELTASGCRWLYGDIVFLDKGTGRSWIRYSHTNRYHYLFKGMPQQAFVFEKKLYEEAGDFDTRYKTVADLDFLLRVMIRDKIPGTYFPSPFVVFHTGGVSGDMLKKKKEREEVIRKYYPKWVFIFIYNPLFRYFLIKDDKRKKPKSISEKIYRFIGSGR